MRLAGVTTALLLVFATKGHMSQVHPKFQTLESITTASTHIVTARPHVDETYRKHPELAAKLSDADRKKIPNYRVESVLRGGKDLKAGDLIHVGGANESFYRAMDNTHRKGLPMPSVSRPYYQPSAARKAEDPAILFLTDIDISQRTFRFFCENAAESIDSVEVVKGYLKGIDSK